ncbi:MAG TPA: high-affinity nickel-transport family protein [Verrucomicrobiae bacterium]|jgi:high-affinity nickel-transport protein
MTTLISLTVLGFLLGMRHATDADHVIAVSTIVTRQRTVRGAALIGAFWGLGHTLTLMAVGAAIVLCGLVIPPKVGMSMEFSVGLMLIILGLWNLKAFARSRNSVGQADFGGKLSGWFDARFGGRRVYQNLRPFLVGIVHGLAGSAALALLVLTMIRNPYWAMAYLAVFGAGTIAGMMLITAAIAWPFAFSMARSAALQGKLAIASGFLSLGFGVFMVCQIGFVDGLLT